MSKRMTRNLLLGAAMAPFALLAACSESGEGERATTVDAAEYDSAAMQAEASAEAVADSAGPGAPFPDLGNIELNLPKLAYSYRYAWELPGEEIGKLQRRHADLCEQQGPASCRIMGMSKSGETDGEVTGNLQLAVATRHARAFGALLEDTAEETGAEQVSADIAAEELSKAIVDTDAQLEARIELRDRLMEVLRTRKGDVKELVEAERSVAQVDEEIEQAKSWLKEMQGRVAYSRVNVDYATGTPAGGEFLAPIQSAVGALGSILGFVIAALIVLGAIILPIGALVWLGGRINRRNEPQPHEG